MSQRNAYYNDKNQTPRLKLTVAILSTDSTGNYTHLLTNRVNKPTAYIPSLLYISHRAICGANCTPFSNAEWQFSLFW